MVHGQDRPVFITKRALRRRVIFWSALCVGTFVVLLGLAVLIPNLMIIRSAKPHIVRSVEEAPQAQCAIILGARIWTDGTPMDMLKDRLETGVRLYEQGKVDKLLLSGEHEHVPYNQVDAMLKYVLDRGVPEEDVFTDYEGLTTYATMYRAREVFQVKSAIIVTQGFHLSRAVCVARNLGLDATGVEADLQTYRDYTPNAAREVLARVKAVLQLYIKHPSPTEADGPFPITGDGRASRK